MTAAERKELLAQPLMQIRKLPPSYLWSGTIVGDRFYGDGDDEGQKGLRDRMRRRTTYGRDMGDKDYEPTDRIDADVYYIV